MRQMEWLFLWLLALIDVSVYLVKDEFRLFGRVERQA
jgi:hypothetical protein